MRAALRPIVTCGMIGVSLAGFAACSSSEDTHSPAAADPVVREALRLRAVSGFARGWLSKPGDAHSEDEAFRLAPLLIHATVGAAPRVSPTRIGTVSRGDDGRLAVDAARPTVYASKTTIPIRGQDHDRWTYLWWNAVSAMDRRVAGRQGIRMTLDASGSPILWEVLADTTDSRLLFVDRALEEAASAEFGPPHPGREHSLARSLEETPDVVVVRQIEAGATPLGPFVYIGEDGRDVHTLLCRCMPSEVDDITGIDEYELLPLEALQAMGIEARLHVSPVEPEALLRLPGLPLPDHD